MCHERVLVGIPQRGIKMGFLDNLVKREVRNAVNDASRSASRAVGNTIGAAIAKDVKSSLGKALGVDAEEIDKMAAQNASRNYNSMNNVNNSSSNSYSDASAGRVYPPAVQLLKKHNESFTKDMNAVPSSVADRGSAEYFADVIEKNVPGARVETNVPLSMFTSENPAKQVNIDVLVRINNIPKLAIILVRKNSYRTTAVVNTMNACEKVSLPAIRFMKEFSNEPGYVSARVKAVTR